MCASAAAPFGMTVPGAICGSGGGLGYSLRERVCKSEVPGAPWRDGGRGECDTRAGSLSPVVALRLCSAERSVVEGCTSSGGKVGCDTRVATPSVCALGLRSDECSGIVERRASSRPGLNASPRKRCCGRGFECDAGARLPRHVAAASPQRLSSRMGGVLTVKLVLTHSPRWKPKAMGYDRLWGLGGTGGPKSVFSWTDMGYCRLWLITGMGYDRFNCSGSEPMRGSPAGDSRWH
ncbi:hypothetical protein BC834DRAFT_188025 [Gloeopeniophorella convolvens]|nr:hypothetical protein BC834DRAFT_188025 [Gloeopeniophorella convolvens]